ncbi:MAG: hypothetical protein ACI9JZ_002853 [Lentimonas sp.]|jgi:hypothetical protein
MEDVSEREAEGTLNIERSTLNIEQISFGNVGFVGGLGGES